MKTRALAAIDRLYRRSLTLVEREINAIDRLGRLDGMDEKLTASAAKDLREYIKLLADMKDVQARIDNERLAKAEAAAKATSDEALERALSEAGGKG